MLIRQRCCENADSQLIDRSMRIRYSLIAAFVLCLSAIEADNAFGDEVAASQQQTQHENQQQTVEPIVVGGIAFSFSNLDQARELLAAQDEFVRRMSPFDRKFRMQSTTDPGLDAFLEFAAGEALQWNDDLQAKVISALDELRQPLGGYSFKNLRQINLIFTSGLEEAGSAYTRGNSIVFQKSVSNEITAALVAHELFHVVSRHDPILRDKLYRIIGFQPAGVDIRLPADLTDLRMTNPDAPLSQHVMKVETAENEEAWVAPVLFAKQPFDPESGFSFFDYLDFQLMEVAPLVGKNGKRWAAVSKDGKTVMHPPAIPSFHRQIGSNTGYILHPEEILADNFALLLTNGAIRDSWVINQIRQTIQSNHNLKANLDEQQ